MAMAKARATVETRVFMALLIVRCDLVLIEEQREVCLYSPRWGLEFFPQVPAIC
jgi:hypothetical protein